MKKPFLEVKILWDVYNNPKDYHSFNYLGQDIEVFFGKNILHKYLKKILGSESLRIISEDMPRIKVLKEGVEEEFGSDSSSKYILTLGGAIVIGEGKVIRNEDKDTRLISVPTSCSNDAFFTNKYKKEESKYHGSTTAALSGLMPDFLVVDTEMIKDLVNEDIIYAGWGEFLALITSYNDWRENNKDLVEKEDLELLDKLMDKMFADVKGLFARENDVRKTIDDLMRLLFMKCLFMMVYDDNTIGASSDHMIAYGMQELNLCNELRHGPKVLFGAIISSECYRIINKKQLSQSIPKKMIDYVLEQECFKKLLNPQDLKTILSKAISSRSRKTIFNKIPSDEGFYKQMVEGVKDL